MTDYLTEEEKIGRNPLCDRGYLRTQSVGRGALPNTLVAIPFVIGAIFGQMNKYDIPAEVWRVAIPFVIGAIFGLVKLGRLGAAGRVVAIPFVIGAIFGRSYAHYKRCMTIVSQSPL